LGKTLELPDGLARMLGEIAREENVEVEDLVYRLLREALGAADGGTSRRRRTEAHCFADAGGILLGSPSDLALGRTGNPTRGTLIDSGFLDEDDDATIH
jgi:hypothetical protein